MSYSVKEIYYTIQGEGAQTGRPAVFCRFAGCNLWSGHEEDRADAVCDFCDTEFVGTDGPGGGEFQDAGELARAVAEKWPAAARDNGNPLVVCTGGEPLLQLDDAAIEALHAEGLEIAIETNGTKKPPEGIDWVCVSPKAGAEMIVDSGDELKLVHPQDGLNPETFERLNYTHFFLQPMDGPSLNENTALTLAYCLENPLWRLSIQAHKLIHLACSIPVK
jgi:7-carboxy-7-deazaguanine synthase